MIKLPIDVQARCEGDFNNNDEFSMIYDGKEVENWNYSSVRIYNQFNSNPLKSYPSGVKPTNFVMITPLNFSMVERFRSDIDYYRAKGREFYEFEGEFSFQCSNPKVKFSVTWAWFDKNFYDFRTFVEEI